ncbi:Glu-tRNA(Gln) amidotransferase subunit GatE, partial [Candidatus Bathyarchaeota archaeon]|nr:Glu-tRNA(Gln) amidotransferase subunit GatE [Candidatus Bathyarchaeota archaeon]NIV43575.1 Glu-tRNA(Gln) amidotransferase subunit GatE [Candidatus Bathyarchaeota archaeon]
TGRVKRGLGTIRQDLNVSIPDGAVIEIKGVQELELVSKIIRYEVQRQRNLLEIRDELHKRGVNEKDIKEDFIDATSVFIETKCGVVQRAVLNGKAVLAVLLPKFAGLLKIELMPGVRLGTEMASRAHFWGRVGGIFHTDELPAYGITKQEVIQLREIMKAEPKDAVVFVADKLENASDALKAVAERAREALRGVPEETRGPNPDGTTRYMRPRPGAARMYPETDVPPLQISEEYLNDLQEHLPELPEHSLERLMKEHKLNKKLARQVLDSEYAMLFEEVARRSNVSPTTIAAVLTETMKALGRDGVEIDKIRDEQIRELFGFVGSGKTAKEAIPEILTWLSKHENSTIAQAIQSLGLTMLSEVEIGEIIDKLIGQNRRLVKERGKTAFGVFMGIAMKKIRGKADADLVSKVLRRKLEESADKS